MKAVTMAPILGRRVGSYNVHGDPELPKVQEMQHLCGILRTARRYV